MNTGCRTVVLFCLHLPCLSPPIGCCCYATPVFHLPEAQVVVLGSVEKLGRGDIVYAVYPDTTSFYQASIVSVPRKSNPSAPYYVNFVDDSDEAGITHDKPVSMKHIMMPPYGAVL